MGLCICWMHGREVSHASFPTDAQGLRALADALGDRAGCIVCGIEGTGSYGAQAAAVLMAEGFPLVEVSRPKRSSIAAARDKSDHADALRAAKRALAGEGVAVKARGGDAQTVQCALAARAETEALLAFLEALISRHAPSLLDIQGAGVVCAAELVAHAGETPSRIKSDSAFARMAGAAPVEASSGRVVRHRLDRGGARSVNAALHTMVLYRMAHDERTRAYVERRTKEGLSKCEIMRCLKRYVCREVYRVLCDEERRRNEQKETS